MDREALGRDEGGGWSAEEEGCSRVREVEHVIVLR